jgi:hypothetical protein
VSATTQDPMALIRRSVKRTPATVDRCGNSYPAAGRA